MIILFLDIDGVLHPNPAAGDLFVCLPHLWSILRADPSLQVVFSTSWREKFDLDTLLDCVTSNGGEDLRDRFIGSNPVLRDALPHQREAECRAWLASHGMSNRPWLALDDDSDQFSDPRQLYQVNPQSGLTAADVPLILTALDQAGRDRS